jgi:hypothetical protein
VKETREPVSVSSWLGEHCGNVFNGPLGNLLAPYGERFIDNNGSIGGAVKQFLPMSTVVASS